MHHPPLSEIAEYGKAKFTNNDLEETDGF